jgi:hypothetical protein
MRDSFRGVGLENQYGVRVGVQGDRDRGMPKPIADHFRMKTALRQVASNCGDPIIKVTLAPIGLAGSGGGGGGSGNCSPADPTVCIPPPPPDLDCSDISFRNFKVLPADPHHFDRDHDGIGCET